MAYSLYLPRLGKPIQTLKTKQIELLDSVQKGTSETVGILPTGYGKSLVYQLLPLVLSGTVIVFSPLSAIQEQQLLDMKSSSLKCCILNTMGRIVTSVDFEEEVLDLQVSSNMPKSDIMDCNLIFVHPEALFSTSEGNDLLQCDRSKVKAIVIDECHKVHSWGKSFRKAFQNLRNLAAFFPGVPRLALSATVSLEEEKEILQSLGMVRPYMVKESPDRENIFLNIVHKESAADALATYENIYIPLCDQLKEEGDKFPVTLVYMPLQYLGYPSAYCKYIFSCANLENCTYGTLCSGQDDSVKKVVLNDLCSMSPRIRLVFCTSVVGMGFDSPSIDRVIHAKPPRNLADYLQEIGRAGRGGQPAEAILHFCRRDIAKNLPDLKNDIVEYCNVQSCLRENILKQFGFTKRVNNPQHLCCSYCKEKCSCFECEMLKIDL